jgi:tripartite-type tricarboxylate transporter receptor subunit TctC
MEGDVVTHDAMMKKPGRREFVAAMGAAALAGVAPRALAQTPAPAVDFPTKPVRIVIPLPPGGANDMHARLIADKLQRQWGQPVTVENKPGGSSIIATETVLQAPADGHTLLGNIGLIIQTPLLRNRPLYVPQRLVPVTQMHRQQLSILVRKDLPIHSMADLFAYARANPGKLNYGSFGIGSTAHLIYEKMKLDQKIDMVHVPYKGGAEIVKAMIAGECDVGCSDFLMGASFVRSGALRYIGASGPERAPFESKVPTLKESGVTGFEGYNWMGLFAPTGTPAAVVRKISDDINKINAEPAVQKRLIEEARVLPSQTTPDDFLKIVEEDTARWAYVIRTTGVKLEG